MLNVSNNVAAILEASGTIPLTMTEINRRLKLRGVKISPCSLGGYLHALNDLEKIAYIASTPSQGGYLSITSYWRLIGKRYHDVIKSTGDVKKKW